MEDLAYFWWIVTTLTFTVGYLALAQLSKIDLKSKCLIGGIYKRLK